MQQLCDVTLLSCHLITELFDYKLQTVTPLYAHTDCTIIFALLHSDTVTLLQTCYISTATASTAGDQANLQQPEQVY
jgi:hypothetical protein